MFQKILIANRGEIACRIIATARRMGIATVAVFSDADRNSLHVELADEAVHIGAAPSAQSYLNGAAIIAAALQCGAQAIHPGYGFLSENPGFVEEVEAAGLTFIGPSASAIRAMGLKDAAKALMEKAGVPVVPGYHGDNQQDEFLAEQAQRIGYPVLIKARAGGGGKGMRRVDRAGDFQSALASARREAEASFGDAAVLVEKYMTRPRHIEIQVFGDSFGHHVYLFERDCSLQRRHQKVIEEAPAPGMSSAMRSAMGMAAARAAAAIHYCGAGTVEFIVDVSDGLRPDQFFFMEMNTRLQVEHPVTEAITGLDLVEWQLRVAAGEPLPKSQDELVISGWSFEARLYAEDPSRDFLPSVGQLLQFEPASGVRVDSGVRSGDAITPFYDPMIAKIISHADSREAALQKLQDGLRRCRIAGLTTNREFLLRLCQLPAFRDGDVDTGLIERERNVLLAANDVCAVSEALAALSASDLLGDHSDDWLQDPWQQLRGFQSWTRMPRSLPLRYGDLVKNIDFNIVSANRFQFAGGELQILAASNGHVRFMTGGLVRQAHVVASADGVEVQYDGHDYVFHRVKLAADEASGMADDRIRAPMPGLIRAIAVEAGAEVRKGDRLVMMEAMKMELTLSAPRDGKVKMIRVALGDQVTEGTILVELEDDHG